MNVNAKLGLIFPEVDIQVDSQSLDVGALESRIAYFATSGARQELKSPYNFASFYLAEKYRDLRRLIYFDTDVIVQGDVAELGHMGLDGNPIATVEDCSQNFELYFDFKQLERMGWTSMWPFYNKAACVFNHGMFVMDTEKWIAANVTVHIEKWMSRFRDSKGTLYKFGLSQPPWLLALYRRYKKLGYEWNLRGLGRNEFVANEKANLASLGFDAEWFRKHGLQGGNRPYVAPHSGDAKLLHFNGRYKPWKANRHNVGKTTALCGTELKPCSKIWWSYISPEAENILKPEKLGTADAL
ncbi:hypothetical protein CYMTET_21543 [Cymbomonas tetramitiformis]|uniref:Hexosyltransferase n=1 Tax=Cymbomonas tetramitiformis TaxID=36881 RepID=A0AAE0G1Z3_9CHLO|nr:hypothetical protein CYMTET_21543 [Cymbomonas tetramitiformis]